MPIRYTMQIDYEIALTKSGADPETCEGGGVDQMVEFDIPYISVQNSFKMAKTRGLYLY